MSIRPVLLVIELRLAKLFALHTVLYIETFINQNCTLCLVSQRLIEKYTFVLLFFKNWICIGLAYFGLDWVLLRTWTTYRNEFWDKNRHFLNVS